MSRMFTHRSPKDGFLAAPLQRDTTFSEAFGKQGMAFAPIRRT